MGRKKIKTEDDFDSKYNPDLSVKSEHYDDGRLETFGKDLDTLNKVIKTGHKRIWTAVDGDDGHVWIVAGCHYVNRIYYLVTKEEWESENEEYRV